jgi:hypothetical protein
VLGHDLRSPSRFVVCWTADGRATGGTGQAIRIAEAYAVPVFNFGRTDADAVRAAIVETVARDG